MLSWSCHFKYRMATLLQRAELSIFLLKNKIINKEFNKIIGKKSWKLVEFVSDIKWIVNVFVKRGDYANKNRFVNEREGPIIL